MSQKRVQKSMDDQAADMADLMLKGGAAGDMPGSRKAADGGMAALAGGKQIDADAEKGGYGMFAPAMGGTATKPPKAKSMGKANPFEGKETPAEEAAEAKMKKAKKGFEDGEGEERDEGDDDGDVEKSAHTGADVTNEPGRQGRKPLTGSAITSEPDEDSAADGAGGPTDLDTSADEDPQHRKRKPGQVGVPDQSGAGGSPGTGEGSNLDQDADDMSRKRKPGMVGIGKSVPTIDADALIKSLDTLEAIAEGSSVAAPADRREALAEKLAEGTLSKAEMQELHALTGAAVDADPLAKGGAEVEDEPEEASFQEQFADDPELKKGYEVSDFLERHSQVSAAALDQIQTRLAKSIEIHRDRAQSFNVQLAKSLKGMAQLAQSQDALIKALTNRLERVETTPLPRKGASNVRTLQKSLDGEVGGGESDQLTRNQLMDGLESMAKSGKDVTPRGHRIDMAIAMLENGGGIAKSLYDDIAAHIAKGSGRVAVS
jgi:hypothetical protein